MKVIPSMAAMQRQSGEWTRSGEEVGFVPTMGALHEGHMKLVRRARKECKKVIVSIYVNPTQFGPNEDLAKYPRPRQQDLAMCRAAGVDFVFAPQNLYLPDHSTYVEESVVSRGRDGASRPGHFRGVATVVLKLFNLVRPTRAYFGQKDAQQVDVITRMVRDLDVPVKLVVVPTVRDPDGVAMSSRNRYLSPEERAVAVEFARLLQHAAREEIHPVGWLRHRLKKLKSLKLDYVELSGDRLCSAVFVGKTRLIDNERVLNLDPEALCLMIQTLSGDNCSCIFTHRSRISGGYGEYRGYGCINGSPIKPNAKVRALLSRLRKYKQSKSEGYKGYHLVITEKKRAYTFNIPGLPVLHTTIAMKDSGNSYGKFYEGSKVIGRVALLEDETYDRR